MNFSISCKINSVHSGRLVGLSVLKACLFPWEETWHHFTGAGGSHSPFLTNRSYMKERSTNSLRCVCVCVLSHSVVFDSLLSRGLQPTRLFCSWDSIARNTVSGSPQPRDGGLLHCMWVLYHMSHQGSLLSAVSAWNSVFVTQAGKVEGR